MEFGSISDILIAFANIVMAIAAAYAALQAKNWLSIKKYELAHSSARSLFFTLFKMEALIGNIESHIRMFTASSTAKSDLNKINLILSSFYDLITDLEKYRFELKRLGWDFKNEYSDINDLPSIIDIDLLMFQADISMTIYLHYKDEDGVTGGEDGMDKQLEYDVRELKHPIKAYDDIINKILQSELEYEEYFDIKNLKQA
ncbi:hypothetical protein [Serratia fonticola]|uniref:hypothetical protein n=1 Tax=Serratia fonticola TaxID=47917 RepID=UPI000BA2844B|nr:hypothetical protein [Serratia fonticola]PAA95470.1 hypothetical protein CJJ13_22155 [Serratia fonticola]